MKKKLVLTLIFIVTVFLAACSSNGETQTKTEKGSASDQNVTIEFFQNKPEAVEIFNQLISDFEEQHPNIKIDQVTVPDPMTVLKTRIARGDTPDIFISYPIEQDYKLRAENGYLLDLTDEPFVDNIHEFIQERYLEDGRMYGVALSQNAVGVLYNKDIFEEVGIEIPTTWTEFLTVLETLKASGHTPILMPTRDAWTTQVFNFNLVANAFDVNYWEQVNNGEVTISEDPKWIDASEKMLQVVDYAQKDSFGAGYDDVNAVFANGEAAMYVMGTWVLPTINSMNSNLNMDVFPFPATEDPSENKLLSGVDVGFAISADVKHPEEAKKFVEFLVTKENAQKFADLDGSLSAVKGVEVNLEILSELEEKVNAGNVTNWPNHFWAGGTGAEADYQRHSQQLFIDKDIETYLKNLDAMFKNYRNQ